MRRLLRIAATVVACALVIEFAYRALSGAPVFALTNWRNARVVQTDLQGYSQYDPVLGWVTRPNLQGHMDTIAYGIRKNQPSDSAVRSGGVLVVGNSFAAGSGVRNDETWPAYLERIIGRPVLNAAVGGYGVDQMVLRAEQLVSRVEPKIVVAAIQWDSIANNSLAVYNVPKPYFVVEYGALVQKNVPVPPKQDATASTGNQTEALKNLLGYSYVADRVAMRFAAPWWTSAGGSGQAVKADTDEIEVSCLLLERLKGMLDGKGIRLVVLLQENAAIILANDRTPPQVALILGCAREHRIQALDTFDRLRTVAVGSRAEFEKLFAKERRTGSLGHMSPAGNRLIAELAAEAIRQSPGAIAAQTEPAPARSDKVSSRSSSAMSEDERILDSRLSSTPHARIERVGARGNNDVLKLEASGAPGEHYVNVGLSSIESGPYTLSVLAKPGTTSTMRLQIRDSTGAGALGDFDLNRGIIQKVRLGSSRLLQVRQEPVEGGWVRLAVSATLSGETASAFVQLLDPAGATSFEAADQNIQMSELRLEKAVRSRPSLSSGESGWNEQIIDNQAAEIVIRYKTKPDARSYEYLRDYFAWKAGQVPGATPPDAD